MGLISSCMLACFYLIFMFDDHTITYTANPFMYGRLIDSSIVRSLVRPNARSLHGGGGHHCSLHEDSWYYFNGKPLSSSLCTMVLCDSCRKVFKWGDQFRRDYCPCGGNVITSRRAQSRRRLTAKGCGLNTNIYETRFERRCDCCSDLEILPGLKYLTYDDPGSIQRPIHL